MTNDFDWNKSPEAARRDADEKLRAGLHKIKASHPGYFSGTLSNMVAQADSLSLQEKARGVLQLVGENAFLGQTTEVKALLRGLRLIAAARGPVEPLPHNLYQDAQRMVHDISSNSQEGVREMGGGLDKFLGSLVDLGLIQTSPERTGAVR